MMALTSRNSRCDVALCCWDYVDVMLHACMVVQANALLYQVLTPRIQLTVRPPINGSPGLPSTIHQWKNLKNRFTTWSRGNFPISTFLDLLLLLPALLILLLKPSESSHLCGTAEIHKVDAGLLNI